MIYRQTSFNPFLVAALMLQLVCINFNTQQQDALLDGIQMKSLLDSYALVDVNSDRQNYIGVVKMVKNMHFHRVANDNATLKYAPMIIHPKTGTQIKEEYNKNYVSEDFEVFNAMLYNRYLNEDEIKHNAHVDRERYGL